MWADLLANKLKDRVEIVNLARSGASNMLISLQVERALEQAADLVIVHFTSCTRETYRVQNSDLPLLDQFLTGSLISYVIPTCTNLEGTLDSDKIEQIRKHYVQYRDLPCTIYLNKCIIESVLYKLGASGTKWAWDQGGFEHHSFGADQEYFKLFDRYRTGTCLWDHAKTRSWRPYYHITDKQTHEMIADRYAEWIEGNI